MDVTMTSISFGEHNSGTQAGVLNGDLNTWTSHSTVTNNFKEQSESTNNHGGVILTGNLSGIRDINIQHIDTIRPLANSLYKSLFSSSELFSQIRNELGLLLSVLSATEEHIKKVTTDNDELPGIEDALNNCHCVINDFSRLKEHFDSVGPQTQVTWERVGWAEEQMKEIRSKFAFYIDILNVLNAKISRSSNENIERMLRTFIDEQRSGKRDHSQMSALSTDSLSRDDKEAWRLLRKELECIGITPDIFNRNRHFILSTLRTLSQDNHESNYHYPELATINEEECYQETSYAACNCLQGAGTHDDMTLLPEFENMSLPTREPLPTPDEAVPKDSSNEGIYKGFTFFKADLPPEMSPTWRYVERTELHFTQRELYKMVRKRAHRYSAAQQYQHLCNLRQAHVNQLIYEHRRSDPSVEWSCVYAKERDRYVHGSHDDFTTISMDVILMRRKLTTAYPRTPMGEIVDLGPGPFSTTSLPPCYSEEQAFIPGKIFWTGVCGSRANNSKKSLEPLFSTHKDDSHPEKQAFISGQPLRPKYVFQGPITRKKSSESLFSTHEEDVSYTEKQAFIPGQTIGPGYVVQRPLTRKQISESLLSTHKAYGSYPEKNAFIPGQILGPGHVVQGPLTREQSLESLLSTHREGVSYSRFHELRQHRLTS